MSQSSVPVTPRVPRVPMHTTLSSVRPGAIATPPVMRLKSSQDAVQIPSISQLTPAKASSESGHSTAVDAHSSSPDVDQLDEKNIKDVLGENSEPEEEELLETDDEDDIFSTTMLPEPEVTMISTYELHSQIHQGEIDLDPPYQRGIVWTEAKQQQLIESLLHNFYVPPLMFAIHRDKTTGELLRICVDGKQRLTSISKFFHGQIPYVHEGTKYLYTKSATQSNRAELPAKLKQRFREKMMTCVEYPEIGDVLERDLFQRVQMGVPLSAAEKLQALKSPWGDFIDALEAQFVLDEGTLGEHLPWNTTRGRDYQGVAYMVYCCDMYPKEEVPSNQNVTKWVKQELRLPSDEFQIVMREVMRTYLLLASDFRYKWAFASGKKVSPVEFVFIGVLLFLLHTQRPALKDELDVKAHTILRLRSRIREFYDDVRQNTRVIRKLWEIVSEIRDDPHKAAGQASASASDSPTKTSNPSTAKATRAKKGTGKKRKYGDDSDDEYRPSIRAGGSSTTRNGRW